MPDFFGVYEDMRAWEYLDFFGRCYSVPREERDRIGVTDGLVRISVGIEAVEDLQEDLERALRGL